MLPNGFLPRFIILIQDEEVSGMAKCCQLQMTSMPSVSVLAFGEQLLKEHCGTKCYLWNLGLHKKSVLETRLSLSSQAVQFTSMATVILIYNGFLWKLRDLQMLSEIINILCLPFTHSKSWNWPQPPHGTQDQHPYNTCMLLHTALNCPGHVCVAFNLHEHKHTNAAQWEPFSFSIPSALAKPNLILVSCLGQVGKGFCNGLQSMALGKYLGMSVRKHRVSGVHAHKARAA